MKKATNFSVNPGWKVALKDAGLNHVEILKRAELPLDLFTRKDASLSTDEYFRFWQALEFIAGDELFPLKMIQGLSSETFDPPIFAALCSKNLNIALKRISQFKLLIGPMHLKVDVNTEQTHISLHFLDIKLTSVPASLIAMELAFFVQLARMATRENIQPLQAVIPGEIPQTQAQAYTEFLGITPVVGNEIALTFSADDANKPFITENVQMWSFFEKGLNTRLSEITSEEGMSERAKAMLLEMLPSGETTMDTLAKRLNISRRTLQRRLQSEKTSFQAILANVREELARHYVTQSAIPYYQISFLLGYEDPNSFFRAFHAWTGVTPDSMRNRQTQH